MWPLQRAEGAQKLVGVCKGTWAVIEDRGSELEAHNKVADGCSAAVGDLNGMGVHGNNEGDFPVFALGVKVCECGPSDRVAGALFLKPPETVVLSALTSTVDLSDYRKLLGCNVLVQHRAKGAASGGGGTSELHRLCEKVSTHHTAQTVPSPCGLMLPAVIFSRPRRALLRAVRGLGWLSHALLQLCILGSTAKRSGPPLERRW